MRRPGPSRRRDQRGSITPMIVGLFVVVAVLVCVVVDASAAFLRKQGLNSVADAAALAATDGMRGQAAYTQGIDQRGRIDAASARRYVAEYLVDSGASAHYPGLRWSVTTTATTVLVRVESPLRLPLHVAGVGDDTRISGAAASVIEVSP